MTGAENLSAEEPGRAKAISPLGRPAIMGSIQEIDAHEIRGWAASSEDDDDHPLVEAFVDGVLRGLAWADRPRSDQPPVVPEADGHGFALEVTPAVSANDLSRLAVYATNASGSRAALAMRIARAEAELERKNYTRVSGAVAASGHAFEPARRGECHQEGVGTTTDTQRAEIAKPALQPDAGLGEADAERLTAHRPCSPSRELEATRHVAQTVADIANEMLAWPSGVVTQEPDRLRPGAEPPLGAGPSRRPICGSPDRVPASLTAAPSSSAAAPLPDAEASHAEIASIGGEDENFKLTLDEPGLVDGSIMLSPRSEARLTGWVLARRGVQSVAVTIDGSLEEPATIGLPRPDVRAAWPDWDAAEISGFVCRIPKGKLARGRHSARISVRDKGDALYVREFHIQADIPGARDAQARPADRHGVTELVREIRDSGLFDESYYRVCNPGMLPDVEPIAHFLRVGFREGRKPNRLFDPAYYLSTNVDVAESGENPLLHFMRLGWREGRRPHPCFDPSYYLARYPDVAASGVNPLAHYLAYGQDEARSTADPSSQVFEIRRAEPNAATPNGEDRERLASYLREEYGEAAAHRVIKYLDIIEAMRQQGRGKAARRELIAHVVERMRRLSRAADDHRPIGASVIVTAFNHVEYTIASVISLLEHSCNTRYEIFIGNNVSSDETKEIFESIGGIVHCITHESNHGFLRNCNLSARHAAGEYIALLNNDTLILDYWLDELLAPFGRFKNVGLTGSKLLMADGSLQEAGGIVWRDGTAWNFGRGQDPTRHDFNYLKDADYFSGAAIAIRKSLWNDVGGFDERYAPAYCEDTDLAFQVRTKGFRTIYSPRSQLIHHDGVTHGTDAAAGVKANCEWRNQLKFVAKWETTLRTQHHRNGEEVFVARDRSARRKHILVMDHYVPQFDRDAGSRTVYHYMKMFADCGMQVTLWPDNLYYDRVYVRQLQDLGIEVLYGTHLAGNFNGWIKQAGRYLDYAFLSRGHICSRYIAKIREHSKAKCLYYGHDLQFPRLEREYEITGRSELLQEITDCRNFEKTMWAGADVIYYPAPEEVEWVKCQVPEKVVRPFPILIYPDNEIAGARARIDCARSADPTAVFVGGFAHRPNVDAVLWYVREVLPNVRSHVPQLTTIIAGSNPPPAVTSLAGDGVVVTGFVSDPVLEWLYRTANVAIAPLRFGGGMKGKVLEAMRFGAPVVSTTPGVEGFPEPEAYFAVADTPHEFAERVVRIIRDPQAAAARVRNGLDYVEREFSYSAIAARLEADIPELAAVRAGQGLFQQ